MKNPIKITLLRTAALLFILFLALPPVRLAARERLVISNAVAGGQLCVWLKWYDEKVFYPEGIVIYRTARTDNQRIKLNERPIRKGDYTISEQLVKTDTVLRRYMAIAYEAKPQDVKEFLSLFLILKTLESNEFARFCGIMYEDRAVVPGEAYSYEVYALKNKQEVLIEKSPELMVTHFVPWKFPEGFDVTAGGTKVAMKWKPDPQSYWGINVYRKTASDTAFTLLNKRPLMLSEVPKKDGTTGYPDVFFGDENLQNGVAYTYKIQGIDYFSRPTLFSKEVTVTPRDVTPPTAPNNVRADVGLLDITLSWQHDAPSSDMSGYHIYRQKGRKGAIQKINQSVLPATQRNYYDTVPEPGVFIYHVAAVDSSGNEGRAFPAVGEVLDIFPPDKPSGLQVTADTGKITLSWNPNTEKDLLGYRVYRTVGANHTGNYVLLNAKPLKTTQFIDSLPKNAKNFFFYKITALDSAYNMSPYSDPRSARMPDIIPPRAPFIAGVIQEAKSLRLEWLDNSESDLMGYDVFRYQPDDSVRTVKQLNTSLIKAGMHLFTDYRVEQNTNYRYFLTAVDSSGNLSAPSVPYDARFIADEACPLKIKKGKATAKKNGEIALTWAIEAGDEEWYAGCVVYRKTPQTNAYKAINTLSKTSKYIDKPDTDDTVLYYQIRAYGQSGCVVKSDEIVVGSFQ